MEKVGSIGLVGADGGPTLRLDLDHHGSGMPAFYVKDHDEVFHWQLNPDSVSAILNLLNDSMLLMMRAMATELYNKSPDDPLQIKRQATMTEAENVVPFRRS